MTKQIHLNLFVMGRGHHEGAWRHPRASRQALTDIEHYESLARKAEAACFDSLFIADALAIGTQLEFAAKGGLEPLTLMAALSRATTHIGLIATASTTYYEPFNLARLFSSLDHISGGRIGWNIVTSWVQGAAENFGHAQMPDHAERYARAREFVEVALKLWDSWADDAIVDDIKAGRYARPERIRRIDHAGKYQRVAGPRNISRSPQGRPVLVQAGSSETGKRFAAQYAEAIFTAHLQKESAIGFHREVKAAAAELGRDPQRIVILPGISPVVGATEREAARLQEELDDLTAPQAGLAHLSNRFGGYDFSHLDLDHPLSVDDFPPAETVQAAQSRAGVIIALVERERPTLRQLLRKLAGARGHLALAGTPERIADLIEDWVDSGAADGFNLMPPVLPGMLDDFAEQVIPLLQKRGRFRREYRESTLRGHYGLERPPSSLFPD